MVSYHRKELTEYCIAHPHCPVLWHVTVPYWTVWWSCILIADTSVSNWYFYAVATQRTMWKQTLSNMKLHLTLHYDMPMSSPRLQGSTITIKQMVYTSSYQDISQGTHVYTTYCSSHINSKVKTTIYSKQKIITIQSTKSKQQFCCV